MEVIDITHPVYEGMVTYPSDPKVRVRGYKKIPESSSNVSEIVLGSHTGTHVDTRRHLSNDAPGVDKLPMESLVGDCKVFDLTSVGKEITPAEFRGLDIASGDIVLFKTRNSLLPDGEFHQDFVYFTLEAAQYLREKKIRTVGIDYVSVQEYHAGDNIVHSEFIDNGITVFEHLNLRDVDAGEYFFVGLPLLLKDGDGAPVRAVLIRQ